MMTRTEKQRQQRLYILTAAQYSLHCTEETCQKTKIITSIEYPMGTKDHWAGNAPAIHRSTSETCYYCSEHVS